MDPSALAPGVMLHPSLSLAWVFVAAGCGVAVGVLVTVLLTVTVGVLVRGAVSVAVNVGSAVNVGVDVEVGAGVWMMHEPPAQDAPNTAVHPPHVPSIGAAQESAH